MAQSVIQHSFAAGEWAPALNARVDLAKYHTAAALVRNFFVDYRGGVSTCPGTRYILQAFKSATAVRIIRFQASSSLGYVLEFGDFYIRFINSGSYVLETSFAITGATRANPGVLTVVGNNFATGDWIFVTGVGGMTQLNGNYYNVSVSGNNVTLRDLNGVNVNSTAFTAYTSGGTAARVYTLTSPYAAADISMIKFTQSVNTMILCHTNYVTQILTLITAANWTIAPMSIGTTVAVPSISSVTNQGGTGTTNNSYVVTAVDVFGQESLPSAQFNHAGGDISASAGSATIVLTATISGAIYYNFYKAQRNYAAAVPVGPAFGFIGYSTTVNFIDQNIAPDFSQTPPVGANPFFPGSSVQSVTVTTAGVYAGSVSLPALTVSDPPSGGFTATVDGIFHVVGGSMAISLAGAGHVPGDILALGTQGISVGARVNTVGGGGAITSLVFNNTGNNYTTYPGSTLTQTGTTGTGTGASVNYSYQVASVTVFYGGTGYTSVPTITFTPAGGTPAAATAVLSTAAAPPGNPAVPTFFQERLVLAGPAGSPQSFYMSQPGFPYNFNISNPIQADDAISGTIVSGQLNQIKAMVPMSNGLIIFGNSGAWLVNGGTPGSPITSLNATAQPQSYQGSADPPPIVINYDILYVQSKGSIVRDLTYNYYLSNYTGTDISILSSHLFYGYTLSEWAYSEEPFKLVWAVRSDGTMLCLTYIKEQEVVGWSHRDTYTNPDTQSLFKSVASVTESVTLSNGNVINVDAVYVVVQRVINGNTVKYIERMAERIFPNGAVDAWCVDAGLQYSGAPATTFSGLNHLIGATVTGLADGVSFGTKTVSASGTITLTTPASKVTVGLSLVPQLQTLRLDVGNPTQQGKRKKIPSVTVRVADTLGLSIGSNSSNLVPMKDLVVGNVGSASNAVVTDLVTDDARTNIDPTWTVAGQYFIQQSNPLPATILGVIPEIVLGDT